MKDRYDKQIDRLCRISDAEKRAERVGDEWECGTDLFQFASPGGSSDEDHPGVACGCLTMIRGDDFDAWTPELTAAIRADKRIPASTDELAAVARESSDVLRETLVAFADWQRRLDREIRGVQLAKDGGGR